MFWKRQVPIAIVTVVGFITLFGWFIDHPAIESFVNDDATQWFDILASFAIFLGALNLLKLQGQKILRRKKGWQYSVLAVLGFLFAMVAGFGMRGAWTLEITDPGSQPQAVARVLAPELHKSVPATSAIVSVITPDATLKLDEPYWTEGGAKKVQQALEQAGAQAVVKPVEWGSHISYRGSMFNWLFYKIFTPLSATMFALLAFFVASASYRAFRIRNFEATLLLVGGIIIMLGRVPVGSKISTWFIMYILILILGVVVNQTYKNRTLTFAFVGGGILLVTIAGFLTGWPVDQPHVLYLPVLQDWIYNFPNVAGARAIMIGIGLGIISTSIRYILGIEKSYIGE
ncbi:MAG: hypothetical protein D6762_00835 [Candidatus Neomarinimicrobiota bacterium]|nr:MAG: hypothetical protein D6762_00835 [Candidatus Neomarinimicrobiota bacterium]